MSVLRLGLSAAANMKKSAGNRKKKQLHYLLIESAWRAVRFNLEYRARYGLQIAKGTNPQRAITIIAKKLLMSIHAVWTQDRNFKVLLPSSLSDLKASSARKIIKA